MLPEHAVKALARPILHNAVCILYALEPYSDAEQAERISALRRGLAELQDSIWGTTYNQEIRNGFNIHHCNHQS